jgi:hypothetical protein
VRSRDAHASAGPVHRAESLRANSEETARGLGPDERSFRDGRATRVRSLGGGGCVRSGSKQPVLQLPTRFDREQAPDDHRRMRLAPRLLLPWLGATIAFLLLFVSPARALADQGLTTCDGPAECCPAKIDVSPGASHAVLVGAVIVGIYEVSEKSSSWTADFYLYESWEPAAGFVPQTEIVNEIERKSSQFDTTELRDGRCMRTRRLHSTLRTGFNLRTFPFDVQTLTLELSDAEFPSRQVHYDDRTIAGVDDAVLHQLAAWKVAPTVQYVRTTKAFRWDPGAPDYDYATFSVTVWRHVSYHLGRYFLPLLLIVIVSFGVFWINPEDLSSEMSVAVTCLLAAVALQLAEGSALPDVNYLTIADRAFATSYVAIALSVLQALYTNHLTRAGKHDLAIAIDRRCRVAFPVGLVLALAAAVVQACA